MKKPLKSLIGILLILLVSSLHFQPVWGRTNHSADMTANVVLFAEQSENPLTVSLGLDNRINLDVFTPDDDGPGAIETYAPLQAADVVIINNFLPNETNDTLWLRNYIIDESLGLMFFGGNYSTDLLRIFDPILPAYFLLDRDVLNDIVGGALNGTTGLDRSLFNYYLETVYNETEEVEILRNQIQVSVTAAEEGADDETAFTRGIAWQSCPLMRDRVFTFAPKEGARTLVEVPDTREPLVVLGQVSDYTDRVSDSKILFVSPSVAIAEDGRILNEAFTLWPYFNFLMYVSVFYLTPGFDNANLETYATWPYAPIPQEREAALWMTFVGFLWVFNFGLFFYLGRKKEKTTLSDLEDESPDREEQGSSREGEISDRKEPDSMALGSDEDSESSDIKRMD